VADPLTIRRLIDRITSGDIRIPQFQRDFVWETEQVAFLLDSIYKQFPIGTVILWRTDARLAAEKNLGSFKLPEPAKDYPVNYVLDGQQRLTSLFSTFQTELQPEDADWIDIYFDMRAPENFQESLFHALQAEEVDTARHFPVKTLFDIVAYRKATEGLEGDDLIRIDDLQAKFKEYIIPNETFVTDDRNKVAIVFERINRAGTRLDVFELLSAWSWSEDFDLVQKFDELQEKIADHGYEDLVEDKDLQLRICAGVITGETSPSKILDLNGEDIRNQFFKIEQGIIGAIDFLIRELGVKHFRMLPYPGILVPLSCFFATDKAEGINYTAAQKHMLIRWFWRSVFTRRFSSDVNERQALDIAEMNQLRANGAHDFKLPRAENKVDFEKGNFAAGNANSKALILMLVSTSPHSFWSGAAIDPGKVLKKGSKHEFHHVFPQAYLEKLAVPRRSINVLANICFLTRSDNNAIKAKSPKEYLEQVPEALRPIYLAEAFCPEGLADLTYDQFVAARTRILQETAEKLMA
jgi:hypothetical protein